MFTFNFGEVTRGFNFDFDRETFGAPEGYGSKSGTVSPSSKTGKDSKGSSSSSSK